MALPTFNGLVKACCPNCQTSIDVPENGEKQCGNCKGTVVSINGGLRMKK
jgi:hypothetical protein